MMEFKFDIAAVECLILAAPEPLAARKIADVIDQATPSSVAGAVSALNNRYMEAGASFRIREIAGGFQFHIIPEYTGYVEELFARQRKLRLTRASLETLAIVAYRQPVTKTDIGHIRGVASDGVLHNLLEKKLVTICGRADGMGRALQYGTTDEFLKFFGLRSLEDLPQMREIEELLKSEESSSQTRLELSDEEAAFVKLNIADGTYRPDEDYETGEDTDTETEGNVPELSTTEEDAIEHDDVDDSEDELIENRSEYVDEETGEENPEGERSDRQPVGVIVDIDAT